LLGFLVRLWGFPWAGLFAALVLAMHPWHVRYGIEGRGYTFVVLLTISGMVMQTVLLGGSGGRCGSGERQAGRPSSGQAGSLSYDDNSRRRWCAPMWLWWLFGLNQALIVWSHLFSVWVCAALAATAAWWIWRNLDGTARRRELCRLLVVNLAAAGLFLQLFLPNILQALDWGERNRDGSVLDWRYLAETLTQIAAGCRNFAPAQAVTAAIVLLLFFVLGGWWMWRRNRAAATLSFGLVLAGAIVLATVALTGMYFYHRFVVALVVPWCVVTPLGLVALPAVIVNANKVMTGDRGWRRPFLVAQAVTSFSFLLCVGALAQTWGSAVADEIGRLRRTPISPLRETAAFLRQREFAGDAVFGYGFGSEAVQYYLPELPVERDADAAQALEGALKAANDSGKRLLVAVGYEELNRRQLAPGGFRLLDDPARFEEVARFDGIEPLFGYRVLDSRPARR
jgi:hypothetical protein